MLRDEAQIVDEGPAHQREMVLWVPETIGGCERISWVSPLPNLIPQFQGALAKAKDERPLQTFFEDFPQALLTGLVNPHDGWVVPKPRIPLSNGMGPLEPDFIVCEWSSVGPDWFIVELESPTKSPLKQDGDTSRLCNHAINQIMSYRSALEEHGHFIRQNGWPKLHGKFNGVVVMGRRDDPLRAKFPDRLRQYQHSDIQVMSYDRVLEKCRDFQGMIEGWATQTQALTKPK